jgi:hypothetical protein
MGKPAGVGAKAPSGAPPAAIGSNVGLLASGMSVGTVNDAVVDAGGAGLGRIGDWSGFDTPPSGAANGTAVATAGGGAAGDERLRSEPGVTLPSEAAKGSSCPVISMGIRDGCGTNGTSTVLSLVGPSAGIILAPMDSSDPDIFGRPRD